jgi:hypothetical protein
MQIWGRMKAELRYRSALCPPALPQLPRALPRAAPSCTIREWAKIGGKKRNEKEISLLNAKQSVTLADRIQFIEVCLDKGKKKEGKNERKIGEWPVQDERNSGGSRLCEQNGGERAGHEGAHHGQRNGTPLPCTLRLCPFYVLIAVDWRSSSDWHRQFGVLAVTDSTKGGLPL